MNLNLCHEYGGNIFRSAATATYKPASRYEDLARQCEYINRVRRSGDMQHPGRDPDPWPPLDIGAMIADMEKHTTSIHWQHTMEYVHSWAIRLVHPEFGYRHRDEGRHHWWMFRHHFFRR